MRIAFEKYSLEPDKMPKSSEEIVERICQDEKVAFLLENLYVNAIDCSIIKIPTPVANGWYGFPLRRNYSPYEKIFNRM